MKKLCKNCDAREQEPDEHFPLQGPKGWRKPYRAKRSFLLRLTKRLPGMIQGAPSVSPPIFFFCALLRLLPFFPFDSKSAPPKFISWSLKSDSLTCYETQSLAKTRDRFTRARRGCYWLRVSSRRSPITGSIQSRLLPI